MERMADVTYDQLYEIDDEILKSKLIQVNKLCSMDFSNFLVSIFKANCDKYSYIFCAISGFKD